MDAATHNAIAKITIRREGKIVSRGTGFQVAPDVLLTALHVEADRLLELPMKERPDHVVQPWSGIEPGAARTEDTLPPDTTVAALFDEHQQAILVLGRAGSGKTTSSCNAQAADFCLRITCYSSASRPETIPNHLTSL